MCFNDYLKDRTNPLAKALNTEMVLQQEEEEEEKQEKQRGVILPAFTSPHK